MFYRNNVRIVDSYKTKSKEDMVRILKCARSLAKDLYGYQYKRTDDSWLKEWQAHNDLHALGIENERTGSVDLNEDETSLRKFGYLILSLLYVNKKTDSAYK